MTGMERLEDSPAGGGPEEPDAAVGLAAAGGTNELGEGTLVHIEVPGLI